MVFEMSESEPGRAAVQGPDEESEERAGRDQRQPAVEHLAAV